MLCEPCSALEVGYFGLTYLGNFGAEKGNSMRKRERSYLSEECPPWFPEREITSLNGWFTVAAFDAAACGRMLCWCREIEKFLLLRWHSLLQNPQTTVASVNEPLRMIHMSWVWHMRLQWKVCCKKLEKIPISATMHLSPAAAWINCNSSEWALNNSLIENINGTIFQIFSSYLHI